MHYLTVHNMILYAVYAHRLKRTGSYVQRNKRALHAPHPESFENCLIKMQPGRRRGNCPGFLGIDSLIAFPIR